MTATVTCLKHSAAYILLVYIGDELPLAKFPDKQLRVFLVEKRPHLVRDYPTLRRRSERRCLSP